MTLRYRIIVLSAAVLLLLLGGLLMLNRDLPRSHGTSPISTAQPIRPASRDMFEGRLQSVPTLVERAEIRGKVGTGGTVSGIEWLETIVSPLRDGKKKDHSGHWLLADYYVAHREAMAQFPPTPSSMAFFEENFAEWQATRPSAPAPYIHKALLLSSAAMEAGRELENSREALPADREVVAALVQKLGAFLAESKSKADSDPGWYLAGIRHYQMTCGPLDDLMRVLEEGSAKFPDFYLLYGEAVEGVMACANLKQHHWLSKVIDLAAARTKAFDGDGAYARVGWHLAGLYTFPGVLQMGLIDWERMKGAINDVLERFPDPWNLNNFAKFACEAGDVETARVLLARAYEAPVLRVWDDSENFEQCWSWATASAPADGPGSQTPQLD